MNEADDGDAASTAEPWPVEDAATVFSSPWLSVERETVRRPDGERDDYFYADPGGDSLAVVAHDAAADELVLVSEYRPKLGQRLLSCPGGGVEDGESVAAAARRELREETGYEAGELVELQRYWPSASIRMRRTILYATDLTAVGAAPDDEEFIDVLHVPVEAAFERAREDDVPGWFLTSLLLARDDGFL